MNVNDMNEVGKCEDVIEGIFKRQNELIEKYHSIEHKVLGIDQLNFEPGQEVNLDSPHVQMKIKDYLWRVTEEVAESYEVLVIDHSEIHQIEELSDALHFMVELMIFIGMKPIDTVSFDTIEKTYMFMKNEVTEESLYLSCFFKLGMIGNCLKNKPWKQTQMRTDVNKFNICVNAAYVQLIFLFYSFGLTDQGIYSIYMKKSEVNKFRQRSNY